MAVCGWAGGCVWVGGWPWVGGWVAVGKWDGRCPPMVDTRPPTHCARARARAVRRGGGRLLAEYVYVCVFGGVIVRAARVRAFVLCVFI